MINVALVNLDTSHVIAFTELFHSGRVPGVRVTHAWRGHSRVRTPDEIEAYAVKLRDEYGVTLVDDLESLPGLVDAALIEANEGSRHLRLAEPFLRAGRRCWIDKPLAADPAEARAIVDLAAAGGTAVFSCSALRWVPAIVALAGVNQAADILTPAPQHEANPGLLHYGIHGVEMLFALLGAGCRQVSCTRGGRGEVCVGTWSDGRQGTLRGLYEGPHHYAATVLKPELVQVKIDLADIYGPLVSRVAAFLTGGESPVEVEEMVEVIAFCDAARRSADGGGAAVALAV
jgi:hypothetical protein